jgi:hypothetical protein
MGNILGAANDKDAAEKNAAMVETANELRFAGK